MASHLDGARVAVTGAGGFIGRIVLGELSRARAFPIPIVGPDATPMEGAITGDLSNPDFINKSLAGADGVIHLAARSGGVATQSEGEILETNRTLTSNVFDAATFSGATRVFAASSAVVYASANDAILESDPITPFEESTAYAQSKLMDEEDGISRTAQGSLDVVFGRFGNVIGPIPPGAPARTTVVYDLIRKAKEARTTGQMEVWGDGTATRSFVHVEDVARAIVRVYQKGESGAAYNIDSGEAVTMGELASMIRDLVAPEAEITFDPTKPTGPLYRVLSIDRLTRLGFENTWSTAQAIESTARSLGF